MTSTCLKSTSSNKFSSDSSCYKFKSVNHISNHDFNCPSRFSSQLATSQKVEWVAKLRFASSLKVIADKKNVYNIFKSCKSKGTLLGLILVKIGSGRLRIHVEDHSGSGFCSFPGFLCLSSGMSPERDRSEPGIMDSEEIHSVVIRRLKADFPSY